MGFDDPKYAQAYAATKAILGGEVDCEVESLGRFTLVLDRRMILAEPKWKKKICGLYTVRVKPFIWLKNHTEEEV